MYILIMRFRLDENLSTDTILSTQVTYPPTRPMQRGSCGLSARACLRCTSRGTSVWGNRARECDGSRHTRHETPVVVDASSDLFLFFFTGLSASAGQWLVSTSPHRFGDFVFVCQLSRRRSYIDLRCRQHTAVQQ